MCDGKFLLIVGITSSKVDIDLVFIIWIPVYMTEIMCLFGALFGAWAVAAYLSWYILNRDSLVTETCIKVLAQSWCHSVATSLKSWRISPLWRHSRALPAVLVVQLYYVATIIAGWQILCREFLVHYLTSTNKQLKFPLLFCSLIDHRDYIILHTTNSNFFKV